MPGAQLATSTAHSCALGDALSRDSEIATIVVQHTSRFMRDATEARLIKRRLRKVGVRVVSATQEIADDLSGHLVEGIMECMDEFESGLIGARTAAAMRESIRQGFYPGARPPFGYATAPVEIRPAVVRHRLVLDRDEAPIVRELFRLYIASHGALTVARSLNERGLLHRGKPWNKTVVLNVLADTTVAGTFYWGRHATRGQIVRPRSEWLALSVEPIIDAPTFDSSSRASSWTTTRSRSSRAPKARTRRRDRRRVSPSTDNVSSPNDAADEHVLRRISVRARDGERTENGRRNDRDATEKLAALDPDARIGDPSRVARPTKRTGGRQSTPKFDLDALVDDATIDCHDESEQVMGLANAIEEHVAVPFETTVLGMPVEVVSIEAGERDIVAVCRRGAHRQRISLLDLPLPAQEPDGAEWIAAYCHWARGR